MFTSVRTPVTTLCLLLLLLSVGLVADMSYQWSFTETTFGGYLGFILPVLACLAACIASFLLGTLVRK